MAFDCDVLIAGGGPTGVTLAILLAQRGVKVIVAEKEAAIYPLPLAAHIDHECMRILKEAEVADEVMATSRRASGYDFLNAKGEVLLRFDGAEQIGADAALIRPDRYLFGAADGPSLSRAWQAQTAMVAQGEECSFRV